MGFTCFVVIWLKKQPFFLSLLLSPCSKKPFFLCFTMGFDLNTEIAEVEEEENDDVRVGRTVIEKGRLGISPSSSSSCSSGSSSSSSASASSIYSELWHACAGPLTSLPKKGKVVVYFPQGHLEQDAMASFSSPLEIPKFDLNPQIFCRVVNVQLLVSLSVSFT